MSERRFRCDMCKEEHGLRDVEAVPMGDTTEYWCVAYRVPCEIVADDEEPTNE